jgi:hypothetical protein
VGFRTPSLDVDSETLELVAERGYLYDSSICPGPFMWLFMIYGKLFVRHGDYQLGSIATPIAPSRPYVPSATRLYRPADPASSGASSLVEIPLSTVPATGVPFYGTLMRLLGPRTFDLGLWIFRRRRSVLHYLLHLLDLAQLDGSSLDGVIRGTPGVGLPFERRKAFTTHVMEKLAGAGESVPMREVAEAYRAERGMS